MLMGVDMTGFLADRRAKLRNVSIHPDPATAPDASGPVQVTDPSGDGTARGDVGDVGDDVEVLPWHRNPINLVAILLAVAVLAAGIGWLVGNNRALADPNETDIGFLQDMRVHHEQAVQMALIYLDDEDRSFDLSIVAREILVGQNIEIGRFIQLLRGFGESEVNETDIAMTWMGDPVPLDRMPGLATQDDLQALADASGAEADALFVQLMTAHHQGGIHMAEHAAEHAATSEVRLMASQMASGQAEEITEMARLLAKAQAG
jgi:uncharacterized protein (DUF305 family)